MNDNKLFITEGEGGKLTRITFADDVHEMNWIESKRALGETLCPADITAESAISEEDDSLVLTVTFSNANDYDILLRRGELGVFVPFNDSYGKAGMCMVQRCHSHVCASGSSAYIMGLRMGGESPNLAMLLCEGEVTSYSIERENKSNDRGDIILHPPFVHLLPHTSYTLKMRFFRHDGKKDFYDKIKKQSGTLTLSSEHFTYFAGESATVTAEFCGNIDTASALVDGAAASCSRIGNTVSVSVDTSVLGEHTVDIYVNGKHARAKLFVSEPLDKIVAARCAYIAEKQQFNCPQSALDGAYLAYDTAEGEYVYDYRRRDINSSRERICMALLILFYLKKYKRDIPTERYDALKQSLMRFVAFYKREIYDVESGTVSNDIGHENSKIRLYNYPWPTKFFLELFELDGDKTYLYDAYNIIRQYYELGGKNFYAFTIPILRLSELFEQNGMSAERDEIIAHFKEHAQVIIDNASDYPAHEVSYEQSIVAPAAEFLLQMYFLTKDELYLSEAKKQIRTTDLFGAPTPDYHTYMCPIRHWDGFWFGKRKLYGDTFPHYWDVLSALAFTDYSKAVGDVEYKKMADEIFRAQMSQFTPDGKATCATLTPLKINGNRGEYRDEWANDQDWALVYYLDR